MADIDTNKTGFDIIIDGDEEHVEFVPDTDKGETVGIAPHVVKRLGQYMSAVTLGRGYTVGEEPMKSNKYPVAMSETTFFSADDAPSLDSNPNKFMTEELMGATNNGKGYTELARGEQDRVDAAHVLVKEGGGVLAAPDIALDTPTQPTTGAIKTYQNAVLSNNRFTDASRMLPPNAVTQMSEPANGYNPDIRLTDRLNAIYKNGMSGGTITTHQLAHIGPAMTLRASSELGSFREGYDPISGTAEAQAMFPGLSQLGVKRVDIDELRVRDIIKDIEADELQAGDLEDVTSKSWGSMNNVYDPFTGISAVGMVALSLALTAAVVASVEALSLLFRFSGGGSPTLATTPGGRRTLGQYMKSGSEGKSMGGILPADTIKKFLLLPNTVNPMGKCIRRGAEVFYGIETSGGLLGAIGSGAKSAVKNPGFNVVTARAIVRSSITIGDQLKRVKTRTSSILSNIKEGFEMLEVLRDSKLMAAFRVFAQLGDAQLIEDKLIETNSVTLLGGNNEDIATAKYSAIDDYPDEGFASAHVKSRLHNQDGFASSKVAWASDRSPGMMIVSQAALSANVLSALDDGGPNTSLVGTSYSRMLLAPVKASEPRIPQSSPDPNAITVENMERILDAEYMPFYFHDLRTNEIISFHAFLDGFDESYSPTWTESDGVGRIDPTMTYKSTSRVISVGFKAVSTSAGDHDDMWNRLNKLVTLVYPQYTKGRALITSDERYKFDQPFSQLVGASPLIRLRIGDVVRSNYSKFALGRLFGLGEQDVTLGGTSIATAESIIDDRVIKYTKKPTREMMYVITDLQTFNAATLTDTPMLSVGTSIQHAPCISPLLINVASHIDFFKLTFVKKVDSGFAFKVDLMTDAEFEQEVGSTNIKPSQFRHNYDGTTSMMNNFIGGTYIFPEGTFALSRSSRRKLIPSGIDDSDSQAAVSKFMSSKENAIVRAFEKTKGKGLAGVIDSLSFNYGDVPWDVRPGHRAPIYVDIKFGFKPIHDVSPGIDHTGQNRAAVYPLGAHRMR